MCILCSLFKSSRATCGSRLVHWPHGAGWGSVVGRIRLPTPFAQSGILKVSAFHVSFRERHDGAGCARFHSVTVSLDLTSISMEERRFQEKSTCILTGQMRLAHCSCMVIQHGKQRWQQGPREDSQEKLHIHQDLSPE